MYSRFCINNKQFLILSGEFSLKNWNIKAIDDRLLLKTQLQLLLELECE